MSPLELCPPLNSAPFFEKALYIKKEHYSNFWTFEIASLANVPRHYLRKYGTSGNFRYFCNYLVIKVPTLFVTCIFFFKSAFQMIEYEISFENRMKILQNELVEGLGTI